MVRKRQGKNRRVTTKVKGANGCGINGQVTIHNHTVKVNKKLNHLYHIQQTIYRDRKDRINVINNLLNDVRNDDITRRSIESIFKYPIQVKHLLSDNQYNEYLKLIEPLPNYIDDYYNAENNDDAYDAYIDKLIAIEDIKATLTRIQQIIAYDTFNNRYDVSLINKNIFSDDVFEDYKLHGLPMTLRADEKEIVKKQEQDVDLYMDEADYNNEQNALLFYFGGNYSDLSNYFLDYNYWLERQLKNALLYDRENYMNNYEKIMRDIEARGRQLEKFCDIANSVIDKTTPIDKDIIIYRGGHFNPYAQVGDVMTFGSLTSTSFSYGTAENFYLAEKDTRYMITIYAPKGTRGWAVNDYRTKSGDGGENEFLLKSTQKYVVVDVDHENHTAEIWLLNE